MSHLLAIARYNIAKHPCVRESRSEVLTKVKFGHGMCMCMNESFSMHQSYFLFIEQFTLKEKDQKNHDKNTVSHPPSQFSNDNPLLFLMCPFRHLCIYKQTRICNIPIRQITYILSYTFSFFLICQILKNYDLSEPFPSSILFSEIIMKEEFQCS